MNKILVFVDEEQCDPIRFYGLGLGNNIVTVGRYNLMSDEEKLLTLQVGEGDRVLLVGKEAYNIFRSIYHMGVRGENQYDVSKLYRLGLHNGCFVKVLHKTEGESSMRNLTPSEIKYFLSSKFIEKRDYSSFKQVVVHTYKESLPFLDYFYFSNNNLGFDYETNGFPMDIKFWITGCSLCDSNYGCFFSWIDIENSCNKEEFEDFKIRFSKILIKNQKRLWAYNLQFEQQVSFREFGVDIQICDASVYNILDAYHDKKYSLKWSSQRLLGVSSWDDDFDVLNDLLDDMYWEKIKDKKGRVIEKIEKCTINDFHMTEEFKNICYRYHEYEDEFISLIKKYWQCPFSNIPSNILGKYCNLDAYHTLMIHEENKSRYTDQCREIYLDNLRLGARLHTGGMYKDENFRLRYKEECNKMIAYGITYVATAYCKLRYEFHKLNANDLDLYNESCKRLLSRGEFLEGNVSAIAKKIVMDNLNDLYESGLDEPTILNNYGEDIYDAVIEGLKDVNVKADTSIGRKKKPFVSIVNRLNSILGLSTIKLGKAHEELEKYLFFKSAYDNFIKIWDTQMKDIYNIPDKFNFGGVWMTSEEYSEFVKTRYFNCTSATKDYPIILEFLIDKYKYEGVFLTTIYYNKNKLPKQDKYYTDVLKLETIDEAYEHFLTKINEYPKEIIDEAKMYSKDPYCENMKNGFSKFTGFWMQADFFNYIRTGYDELTKPYSDEDLSNNFKFLRKFILNQSLFQKYTKVRVNSLGQWKHYPIITLIAGKS